MKKSVYQIIIGSKLLLLWIVLSCSNCGGPSSIFTSRNDYQIRYDSISVSFILTVKETDGRMLLQVPEEHVLKFPPDYFNCPNQELRGRLIEFVAPNVYNICFPIDDENQGCYTDNLRELLPKIKFVAIANR